MDSEEAIMENENNSNLESQSNMREQMADNDSHPLSTHAPYLMSSREGEADENIQTKEVNEPATSTSECGTAASDSSDKTEVEKPEEIEAVLVTDPAVSITGADQTAGSEPPDYESLLGDDVEDFPETTAGDKNLNENVSVEMDRESGEESNKISGEEEPDKLSPQSAADEDESLAHGNDRRDIEAKEQQAVVGTMEDITGNDDVPLDGESSKVHTSSQPEDSNALQTEPEKVEHTITDAWEEELDLLPDDPKPADDVCISSDVKGDPVAETFDQGQSLEISQEDNSKLASKMDCEDNEHVSSDLNDCEMQDAVDEETAVLPEISSSKVLEGTDKMDCEEEDHEVSSNANDLKLKETISEDTVESPETVSSSKVSDREQICEDSSTASQVEPVETHSTSGDQEKSEELSEVEKGTDVAEKDVPGSPAELESPGSPGVSTFEENLSHEVKPEESSKMTDKMDCEEEDEVASNTQSLEIQAAASGDSVELSETAEATASEEADNMDCDEDREVSSNVKDLEMQDTVNDDAVELSGAIAPSEVAAGEQIHEDSSSAGRDDEPAETPPASDEKKESREVADVEENSFQEVEEETKSVEENDFNDIPVTQAELTEQSCTDTSRDQGEEKEEVSGENNVPDNGQIDDEDTPHKQGTELEPSEVGQASAETPKESEVSQEPEVEDTEDAVEIDKAIKEKIPSDENTASTTSEEECVAQVATSEDATTSPSGVSFVEGTTSHSAPDTSVGSTAGIEDSSSPSSVQAVESTDRKEETGVELPSEATVKADGLVVGETSSNSSVDQSVTQASCNEEDTERVMDDASAQEDISTEDTGGKVSEGALDADHGEVETDQHKETQNSTPLENDSEATVNSIVHSESNEVLEEENNDVSAEPRDVDSLKDTSNEINVNEEVQSKESSEGAPEVDPSVEEKGMSAEQQQSGENSNEHQNETSAVADSNDNSTEKATEIANVESIAQVGKEKDESDRLMSTEAEDDDDLQIIDVKKEQEETPMETSSENSENNHVSVSEVKMETEIEKETDPEDDVVVLDDDDDDESIPVKAEIADTKESKIGENGLGIQISAVAGQQHKLHASADSEASSKSHENKPAGSKSKSGKSKTQTCIVCQKVGRCKYNIVRNGDVKHLCDDVCFKNFRSSPSKYLKYNKATKETKPGPADSKDSSQESALKDALNSSAPSGPAAQGQGYKTCAVCQLMNLNTYPFCNWQGLDFCGESCLGRFQGNLASTCSFCNAFVPVELRTSFCLKIGNEVRPFCKSKCYSEFRRMLRLCAFCQKNLSSVADVVTAQVGDAKAKEFCSKDCQKKMEDQINDVEVLNVNNLPVSQSDSSLVCSVCRKKGTMKHNVRIRNKTSALCSDLCLSAFQYSNKIAMSKCDSCGNLCTAEEAQAHFVQFEGNLRRFCSEKCVNRFRVLNSKMVPCTWCSTSKPNFDMIERLDVENKFQLFCSLNCLSLYRVNLQAKSNQAVNCDQCKKTVPAQYHLTMSDASVRNFCSYPCVMAFQSQFSGKPQTAPLNQTSQAAVPLQQQETQKQQPAAGGRKRGRVSARQASKQGPTLLPTPQAPTIPVISSVVSLAPQPPQSGKQQSSVLATVPLLPNVESNIVQSGDGKQKIVIQQPPPKVVKNKSVQCRPVTQTKATSCRPHSQPKEVQTDEVPPRSIPVPVPVPIYIPMPTAMYSVPTPLLIPVPIPIPIPMFIPTTRKSANGILKSIKEIADRMPADPLEAELLMMAEAVALVSKEGDSDTDSEDAGGDVGGDVGGEDFTAEEEPKPSTPPPPAKEEEAVIVRKREGGGEEDMIQMALRMAEEMSGPIEDLESSVEPVVVNTEPPPQLNQTTPFEAQDEEYTPSKAARGRGMKRASRGRPPASRPKRQRVEQSYAENEPPAQTQPPPQPVNLEPPPDASCRLKFTYGVNAWRHWVISKNAQLEKTKITSGLSRIRTFPTDILKCTTDELNFTLCMFIKEVRKPNGEEYSPDSVYYLCLGIQQYLYENGRIDNIFTDLYFEKYTDCLHDILKTLQPKVNNQGQTLCRIEEEHLWESKQLGAHSPYVLLNTLIYFHTKHFILKTAQEHMSLSFAQILKHLKKGVPAKGQTTSSKNVALRYYCLANGKKDGLAARKSKEGVPVYEVTENFDNPLRCPVKLYEFFLSKCPESIKNRHDIFYPVPERSCVPDSPVWYSTQSVDLHTMDKMLTRILLVREIQESHLHAQPIYL